jgi:hypothetical protein
MTRRNLIVLENPWEDQNGDIATYSMRPFVEGLCELYEHRLIYRTFTSGHELARLVEREAMDSKPGRYLLYLSSHGYGGRLVAGRYSDKAVNVAPIASKLCKDVIGVWVGACDVGNGALGEFLVGGGATWAGGYCCGVNWDASMLIDLAVLQEAMATNRAIDSRTATVSMLAKALARFDPDFEIGVDVSNEPISLRDALRVVARDRVQGSRPRDVSDDLLTKLGWTSR